MLSLGNKLTLTTQPIYKFVNKYSIDFDGVDDRIITDGADTVAQNSTYSFWCKSSETGENKGVFGHGTYYRGAFHFNYSSDKPRLYYGGGFYVEWDDTSAQDDGEWHHWVVYVDINTLSNSKLYCDGVLQTGKIVTTGGVLADYTQSLTIGSDAQTGSNSFVGKIDEFAVYDRELTQAEITRMYNTYYSPNRVANGNFSQIGNEEVTNGDFSQIGSEEVTNGDFSQIGSEEVTNGDFASDTWWGKDASWTISGGSANSNGSGTIYKGGVLTIGKTYKVTVDISAYTSGSVTYPNASYTLPTSTGTYTFYYTAASQTVSFSGTSFIGSIDNVSVKEVGQDWTFGSAWSTDNTKAIYDDSAINSITQNLSLSSGKSYKIQFQVNDSSGSGARMKFGNAADSVVFFDYAYYTDGLQTLYYNATSNSTDFNIKGHTSGSSFNITNISVKEVGQDWGVYTSGTSTVTFEEDAVLNIDGSNSNVGVYQENVFANGTNYKIVVNMKATASFDAEILESQGASTVNTIGNVSLTTSYQEFTFYYQGTGTNDLFIHRLSSASGANQKIYIKSASIKEVGQHWTLTNGWSIDDTKATNDGTGGQIYPTSNSWTSGATIKFQVTVSGRTTGHIRIQNPSSTIYYQNNINTNNSFEYSFTTIDADGWRIEAVSGFDGSIDNIVVQELKHDATNLMLNAGAYQSANPLITSTKSMDFNGSDEYLQLSEPFSYTNHTICAWVYNDSVGTDEIFSASDSVNDGIRFMTRSTGNFRYRLNSVNNDSAAGTFEANKWYFVVGTYDGTTSNLYINGALSNSVTTSQTISITTNSRIGSQSYNVGALYDGNITEVGAFNRALTALEVASLYNQGMPTNLLVNRNNYQSGNPTVFNTKQVDFDGTDDRLVVTNAYGSFTGSVSAWVKRDTVAASWIYIADFRTNSGSGYLAINSLYNIDTGVGGTVYVDNVVTSAVPQDTEWHHVVVTGIALNITESIFFGSRHTSADFFDGDISQIGMWNSTLTADEVSSLYNHGLPIDLSTDQAAYESSSNLVGYWRMGSGTLDTYPLIADQTNATLGSELLSQPVDLQTDFINNSGGVIVDADTFTTSGGTLDGIVTSISLTIGKTYKLTVEGNTTSSGFTFGSANGTGSEYGSGFGTHYFTALHANIWVRQSTAGTTNITSFTLKQVQGNPAIMTNQTSSDIENGSPYANIVQDSDFSEDSSDWSVGTGWQILNGKANVNATSFADLTQNIGTIAGKTYRISYEVSNYVTGSVKVMLGYGSTPELPTLTATANGIYTVETTANTTNPQNVYVSTKTATTELSIDNVTVEEVNTGLQGYWKMGDGTNDEYPVIYDQVDPTLGSDISVWAGEDANVGAYATIENNTTTSLVSGKMYRVAFTVSNYTSGSFKFKQPSGGVDLGITGNANGDYVQYGIATNNTELDCSAFNLGFVGTISNYSVQEVQGNPATMTNMVEGNITNQYPLTKIRNYYRMGDGILDGYPIIQDQTSPNLAHIPTTNIVPYSEDLSQWTIANGTLTPNATVSPDGTQNADKVVFNNTGLDLKTTVTVVAGQRYTISFYIKLESGTGLQGRFYDNSNSANIEYYDFTSQVQGTEWSRVTRSVTAPSGCTEMQIWLLASSSTLVTASFWGAQFEEQSQATAYIKSDGIAAVRKSSTTNLIKYSEDFTQSFWTPTRCTITSNQITSPNGTLDADLLTATDTSENYIQTSNTVAVSGTSQTVSFYVKKGTSDFAHILLWDNSSNGARQWFDLTNGTIGTSTSFGSGITVNNANMISYSNDWYRCIVVFNNSTANIKTRISASNSNGSTTSTVGKTIYIWGAQLELQTQAETYAKTTGLPVTIDLFTENNYGTMTNMSASDIVEDTP